MNKVKKCILFKECNLKESAMISLLLPTLANSEQDLTRLFNSLEAQTNKNFELIVISQSNHELVEKLLSNYTFSSQHIKINKRGLSLARNVGLRYVNGDILTLSDDDCWYKEDAFEYIHNIFEDPAREIVCFQHMDPIKNAFPKKYPDAEEKGLTKRRVLQQASIDIFVHTERVPDYKIGFDESFGLGARYNSGEENIFLMDLKNKGYKIDYIPKVISYHPIKDKIITLDSTTVISKGPLFKRLFGGFQGLLLYIAFFLKNFGKIEKKFSLFKGIAAQFKYKK